NGVNTDDCKQDCTLNSCGDGVLHLTHNTPPIAGAAPLEACDDNNNHSSDGCSAGCEFEPGWNCSGTPTKCTSICGDGIVVRDEACDDGNTTPKDGCSKDCKMVEAGWYCTGAPSLCTTKCGDGIVAGTEECDDGNAVSGDGCSSSCGNETGWDCLTAGVACV